MFVGKVRYQYHPSFFLPSICGFFIAFAPAAYAQANNSAIHGTVADPTGAVMSKATVKISTPDGRAVTTATSDASGLYQAHDLAPGSLHRGRERPGLCIFRTQAVTLDAGQSKQLDIKLQIQVEKEQLQVEEETTTVDTSPENNANAIIIKGKDLDALSDDPDELQVSCRRWLVRLRDRTAGKFISTASPVVRFRRNPRSAKSASTRIRFPPSTTGWAMAASKYSPSPAPTSCMDRSSLAATTRCSTRRTLILNSNLKPGEPAAPGAQLLFL